jgi:hypothetical protein
VNQPAFDLRRLLRRILLWTVFTIIGISLAAFSVDWLIFRIRVAANRNAYGSVPVNHYYAVLQKNGKTQFIFDPVQNWNCVNALFPHSGSLPCWYLQKHPDQRTDI